MGVPVELSKLGRTHRHPGGLEPPLQLAPPAPGHRRTRAHDSTQNVKKQPLDASHLARSSAAHTLATPSARRSVGRVSVSASTYARRPARTAGSDARSDQLDLNAASPPPAPEPTIISGSRA